jgi:hypothetical protein
MVKRAVLVVILLLTVWSTAVEARSGGGDPPDQRQCARVQLPPGVRVPLGARLQVVDRCDLELRKEIGEGGLLDRVRSACRGLQSRRCATDPFSAS